MVSLDREAKHTPPPCKMRITPDSRPRILVLPGSRCSPVEQEAHRGFQSFWASWADPAWSAVWYEGIPWHGAAIHRWLTQTGEFAGGWIVVAFSAGVVGALGLASLHPHLLGVIAWDGWCVPLRLPCRVSRLSHDLATHQNGWWWGQGQAQFYADPFVDHLQLWRDPRQVEGWIYPSGASSSAVRGTASHFLKMQLAILSD
ncbi:MAG: hypothetical protein NW237_05230 [Cyanobacteriota bacterium]|nr:hypothetical protein [Cyanobacteriota bacterium]